MIAARMAPGLEGPMARSKSVVRSRPPVRSARKATPWKAWLIGAVAVVAVGVFGFFAIQGANHRTTENPATKSIAEENAGGVAVKVLTGPNHTVYHSTAPLPSASAPRSDGKPTLIWFSATTCEYCEQMEPWAHSTAHEFLDRALFVEKSVNDDPNAAGRYGVRGTPTFVLIDARGQPIAQFGFQPTQEAFRTAITKVLQRAGV
jgi:thiol-disulfide isomerase/thioredoxin